MCHQIMDIAQGLKYLHESQPTIIHGDLKGVSANLPDELQPDLSQPDRPGEYTCQWRA